MQQMSPDDKATIDFETRSPVDIMKQGAAVYSEHPDTEVMCLMYKLPGKPVGRWIMPEHDPLNCEPPQDLFDWIAAGGLVEAHNAFFERMIWKNICVARMGWPAIPHLQWRCSAAKCSSYALPRSLGGATDAMKVSVRKSEEGRKLMLKLCKPRKPKKAERLQMIAEGRDPNTELLWHEEPKDLQGLWDYCATDVEAEHSLSLSLADLPPDELRTWQMDQAMNERGVLVDHVMVRMALKIAETVTAEYNKSIEELTGGAVKAATQRSAFKAWANEQGVTLEDTKGDTLDEWLDKEDMPWQVRRAMNCMREVNRTSTAKYKAMLNFMCRDGRIRDLMMYHGASTGRWAGKGPQPHNFPRGTIEAVAKDIEDTCRAIRTKDIEWLRFLFGPNVMEVLSCALRGAIIPSEGRDLMVADYAAIEARVVFWLAEATTALEVFYRGEDIYLDMANDIYGYKCNKKEHPSERQMGKQSILGLGFGMGFLTFLLTCRKYDIVFNVGQVKAIVGDRYDECLDSVKYYFKGDKKRVETLAANDLRFSEVEHELVLMQYIVQRYRARYPEVPAFWAKLEAAAMSAVRNKGQVYAAGKILFKVEGRFLFARLPSGRKLAYCDPFLKQKKMPWKDRNGDPVFKETLFFWAVNPKTKQWSPQDTYGGTLCENVVQATARDLMRDAMLRADDGGVYDVLLSVHDELIAEVDEGVGNVKEFEDLMSETAPWAAGCPVAAEGWRGKRYRK